MSHRVAGLVVGCLLALTTACSGDPEPSDSEPTPGAEPPTADRARTALTALDDPADGEFAGGEFDIGTRIDSSEMVADGLLSSASWDVYFVRDDGGVGSWGTGIDVLDSPARARAAARREAGFLVCQGTRRPVTGLVEAEAGGHDGFWAWLCRKPGDDGFWATAGSADGVVAATLTVSGDTRRDTVAALTGVWPSVSEAAGQLADELS